MDLLTKSQYLALVRNSSLPQEGLEDRLDELKGLLGTPDEEERLRDMAEAFMRDVNQGIAGIVQICPLHEVRKFITNPAYELENWHYDRTAQCLLVNLRRGRHERLSALLCELYRGTKGRQETQAEAFLNEGLGWFLSSSSNGRMLKGEDVKLNAQERVAFASVRVYD